ncbi:MAG TPA: alanine--glyoxylate aminotransferase family protein [Gemmatales bacterium]|nr:alanine--glyoxylate aminotransferase family protein [Gemmatales bacterium]
MSIPFPRLLLGPGPSEPHPEVLAAQQRPLLGHLDPDFLQILTQVQQLLRQVLQTKNEATFAISGTGMAGMECVLRNLLEPGDRLLVCTAGFFGDRMVQLARRAEVEVVFIQEKWGSCFSRSAIAEALETHRPRVLAMVHAETSTGVLQPLEGLGELCHKHGTLLAVDTVTSLATSPLAMDDLQIDALYSGSQKGLGCPPGLAPVSFSPKAMEIIRSRRKPVVSYYLDVVELLKYWGEERSYHHTAPISSICALQVGLQHVLSEGLEKRWQRHLSHAQMLKAGLARLGITCFTDEHCQAPALTCVNIPPGCDDLTIRKKLLEEHGIEIGGGLGTLKGRVWRIGLMGYGSRAENVERLLEALSKSLRTA